MARRGSRGRKKQPQRRPRRSLLQRMGAWVPVTIVGAGAIVLVLAFIVVGAVLRGDSDKEIPDREVSTQGRTIGPETARVTVVEYSDFQCGYCARAARTMAPRIEEDYIKDGRVKLVFRHLAFMGQESIWAAEASECANEQGRFWDYHDKLFENQKGVNRGAFAIDNLKRFAEELGLDTQAFNLCLDSTQYEGLVKEETQDAAKQGIGSTPTFVIGEQVIAGPRSYEELRNAIEAELRKNP